MENCPLCRVRDAEINCPLCPTQLCKKCAETVDSEAFPYQPEMAKLYAGKRFCPSCFDNEVAPKLAAHDELLEKAREVPWFPRTYRRNLPIVKKSHTTLSVTEGLDRDDILLRLGFMTVEKGYNAMIEVEVAAAKVRNHGYQKMVWQGTAHPIEIDVDRLVRVDERDEREDG